MFEGRKNIHMRYMPRKLNCIYKCKIVGGLWFSSLPCYQNYILQYTMARYVVTIFYVKSCISVKERFNIVFIRNANCKSLKFISDKIVLLRIKEHWCKEMVNHLHELIFRRIKQWTVVIMTVTWNRVWVVW